MILAVYHVSGKYPIRRQAVKIRARNEPAPSGSCFSCSFRIPSGPGDFLIDSDFTAEMMSSLLMIGGASGFGGRCGVSSDSA
jgi:hypothetical protein